ncbi:hypothetical protein IYQ_01242 [Aeromonas salmonicida subsp. salmonicida 01-B526]|uniref:Uncharacterized protein n=1 Tax=Aeromonas salmonicida subsp. salmonicida 01-B526 TaxID=1076135 RepID=A0ABN0E5S3_AERSS|nr:hypothetical protein IYQ_01242 [Aeromonas salmonicida subsp. salmonicida 01-B526]
MNDKVISLEQANQLQRALEQPLPDSPTELEPEIGQISLLLHLHQMDSSRMTKH